MYVQDLNFRLGYSKQCKMLNNKANPGADKNPGTIFSGKSA